MEAGRVEGGEKGEGGSTRPSAMRNVIFGAWKGEKHREGREELDPHPSLVQTERQSPLGK